eukprot:GEMP01068562.1.p1 GENE.GEMP01068562.1~~GEMP01068562.1.p1  ORF type:complete len:230 (+),score=39.12 GEMP01068562.1:63-752(+)
MSVATLVYRAMFVLIPSLAVVVAFTTSGGPAVLFWYHPVAMSTALFVCTASGIMHKKIGGFEKTKLHGLLMSAAVVFFIIGGIVIYVNKTKQQHPHLVSLHSKFGFASIVLSIALGLVGGVGLHPVWGVATSSSILRMAHKWGGRTALMLMFVAAFLGFQTLHGVDRSSSTALFGVTLSLVCVFLVAFPAPDEFKVPVPEPFHTLEDETDDVAPQDGQMSNVGVVSATE